MKLGIAIASFRALGEDEPEAIVQLLRSGGPQHGLSPLEEARFVDELHSVREIDGLAHGFFRGPDSFRQEILQGNLKLALQLMDQMPPDPEGCSEFERIFIQDLESLQKGVLRILSKSQDQRLQSRAFMAQVNLLSAAILSRNTAFLNNLRILYDRSGQA